MNRKPFLIFCALMCLSLTAPSLAQQTQSLCTALLSDGVFDYQNTTRLYTKYSHVKDILCSGTYSEYNQGRTKALQAAIPLDGLLVPFGYKQDDNSYATSRSAFCSQNESELYIDDKMISAIRQADSVLAEQFNKCISTLSAGTFEYYINVGADPATFQVQTIYRQGVDKVYPIVKLLSIRPDAVARTCDKGHAFDRGRKLGLTEAFTCTRQPGQGVTVSLSTSITTTSGPAVLKPYVNEHIVKRQTDVESKRQAVASRGENRYGPEVCVDAPEGYIFDLQPRVEYDSFRGDIYGDESQPPLPPIITKNTPTHACGMGGSRPDTSEENYRVIYHVVARGYSSHLETDDHKAAAVSTFDVPAPPR